MHWPPDLRLWETTNQIGLTIPQSLLYRADKVIR
jgi:hypothetical protein